MLNAFARAFRTPDLRRKMLFTLFIVSLFRLGSFIPTPGVSYAAVETCVNQVQNNSLYNLVNLFSLANPASGAVFRCELDGSGLEVYATGLRNPQELAFNDIGDLFSVDNNSDSGDRARVVHILEGGDSGWRMHYQYLPDRGPFNRERIWEPFHPEQPAYIVPPITNFTDGPSGLAFYPGTGFGDQLKDTFLICDFRGGPANSGIRSFKLEPDGAFYRMTDEADPIWTVLATDLAYGPDGALYVSDWVDGWDGLGKGRIYRLSDPLHSQTPIVREVQRLLEGDWQQRPTEVAARRSGAPRSTHSVRSPVGIGSPRRRRDTADDCRQHRVGNAKSVARHLGCRSRWHASILNRLRKY